MPLQKALVPLDFTQGVDTKTDGQLLQGRLSRLDNGVFSERGTVSRRDGHELVADFASLGLSADAHLFAFEDMLLARDKSALHAYASGAGTLKNVGTLSPFTVTKRSVVRSTVHQWQPDAASLSGIILYAWDEESSGVATSHKFLVREEATGVVLQSVTLGAAPASPRAIAFSDRLAIVYVEGANLRMVTVATSTPTTYSGPFTLRTDVDAADYLDAIALSGGSTVAVAYNSSAGIRLVIANSAGTVTAGPTAGVSPGLAAAGFHLNVFSGGNLLVAYSSATTCRRTIYDSALSVVAADAQLDATGTDVEAITSIQTGTGLLIFHQCTNTDTPVIRCGIVGPTGTVTTAFANFVHGFLSTAPFTLNSRTLLGIRSSVDENQATLVLVERDASTGARRTVGALLQGSAAGAYGSSSGDGQRIQSVRTRSATDGAWPVLLIPEYPGTTPTGFSEVELRLDVGGYDVERNRLAPAQYGKSLYFPGACLQQFDGQAVYETGFVNYPGATTLVATGGTNLTDGATYQYCAVYEFVDAQGALHRSAPSVADSITVSGANRSVNLTFTALPHTGKPVGIGVYRTTGNGTTFYRLNGINTLQNTTTARTVAYADTSVNDTTLASRERLYTTGGVLENIAPPASVYAHVHQQRLFLIDAEDRTRVVFSSEAIEGHGPTFNETLELRCGPTGGDVVGLASIDDKLILLRERELHFVAGEGPNDAGQMGTYSAPQLITADTGCVSPASIVQTPEGVMFKGERGLYLLNRALQLVWLGEAVESLTGRVACAQVVPGRGQVRFSCPEDSRILVWDYHYKQWSSFTGLQLDGMAILASRVYALTRGRALWRESSAAAGDNSAAFAMTLETPWLKVAGLQGFQRVWRALLLGTYEASSTLTLEVGYDYTSTYTTVATVTTSTLTGGVAGPMQLRHHLATQKCESIRFRITCSGSASGVASLGCALSNLTLEVGVKRGGLKLASTRTV